MKVEQHTHEFYEEVLREHRDLLAIVRRIRQAIGDRRGGKSGLPTMLAELSAHLSTHFAFESDGGYLNEALENAPRLQGRADALEAQHPKLLTLVMELRQQVNEGTESDAWWEHIEQRFADFSKMLIEHESGENQLVQEAFDRDTGSQD